MARSTEERESEQTLQILHSIEELGSFENAIVDVSTDHKFHAICIDANKAGLLKLAYESMQAVVDPKKGSSPVEFKASELEKGKRPYPIIAIRRDDHLVAYVRKFEGSEYIAVEHQSSLTEKIGFYFWFALLIAFIAVVLVGLWTSVQWLLGY